jgi:hypothetical protein
MLLYYLINNSRLQGVSCNYRYKESLAIYYILNTAWLVRKPLN